ncbi:unnamed protein product, partial [Mycena citricolor]
KITWKVPDAWIWVGTPAVIPMVLHKPRVMHPHQDPYYNGPAFARANLQSYSMHRQNYLENCGIYH